MTQDVALFIDYEPLLRECRSQLDTYPDLKQLGSLASGRGRLSESVVLADWIQHDRGYARVAKSGMDPVHDRSLHGKNAPDERGAAFAATVLAAAHRYPLRTFVVACPAGPALALTRHVRALGGRLVWLGFNGEDAKSLHGRVDEVITIDGGTRGKKDSDTRRSEKRNPDKRSSEKSNAPEEPFEEVAWLDVDGNPADPYAILVEIVTASAEEERKPSLNALKDAMIERIPEFDETRMQDGKQRVMRRFKDFVQEAAFLGLVKLRSRGRRNEVTLPPAEGEKPKKQKAGKEKSKSKKDKKDKRRDEFVDTPHGVIDLLDTEEESAPAELDDEDNEAVPPRPFLDCLDEVLQTNDGEPMAITPIVEALGKMRRDGRFDMKANEVRKHIQACINIELLEDHPAGRLMKYNLPDDWREVIEYL